MAVRANKRLFETIKCPYCFKIFSHSDVLFRSMTVFEEYELDPTGENMSINEIMFSMPNGPQKDSRVNEYRRRERFLMCDDYLYNNFWKDFGGTSESGAGINEAVLDYRRPILIPSDKNTVAKTEFDEDGFLYKIEDVFGKESYDRVCPRCHNPLPSGYGKHPIKFISVIGISSSGKTVFLSKLAENLGTYLAKLNMTALPATKWSKSFSAENQIALGKPLPGGNPIQYMSQPLFYDISYNTQNGTEECMLVFYDIAGESCVDSAKIKAFGKFVMNASGLIILIDPKQFRVLDGNAEGLTDSVLATLKNTITTHGKVDIPTAICISKSDLMYHLLAKEASVCYEDVKTVAKGKCRLFSATDYNQISRTVHNFIEKFDNQINVTLNNIYNSYNYFAFTAMNGGVKQDEIGRKIPESEPDPKRIEEPLFWMFKEFGYIGSDIPVREYSQMGVNTAQLKKQIADLQREYDETNGFHVLIRNKIKKELEYYKAELAKLQNGAMK